MLDNLMSYCRMSEVSIGQEVFKDVILKERVGKFPAGTHFDCCMLNIKTGKMQLLNYDRSRATRYGFPIKDHHDFTFELNVKEDK